jgi:phosphatidylglycerophosphate synthase
MSGGTRKDGSPVSNFNPANAMTGARFLFLPPFFWAVDHGYTQWAMLFVLISAGLDQFDGVVARLLDCVTPFGAIFDAITDAICYGFMMVVLVGYGWVPWEPVAIILGLGAVNTVMRARYAQRAGRPVNYRSWAMEKIVAFVGYLCGFGVARIEVGYYYWSCAILMGIVMIYDTKRMLIDPFDPTLDEESHAPPPAPQPQRAALAPAAPAQGDPA